MLAEIPDFMTCDAPSLFIASLFIIVMLVVSMWVKDNIFFLKR